MLLSPMPMVITSAAPRCCRLCTAPVVMGRADWDLVAKHPNRYKTMVPKRDIVATDGMKITQVARR